ncbi:MAG TPA: outer membrane lipoprotein-sorting protein [Polyangium sp.]|jgi:outer membrane lipoprotein-sorting protein|uniref:Outer membrane lipoprotein-sorting protein n=1 Tax=Polyangium sorediatum TaxID=889274 RepID=A0ABT6PA38_9BACT|nr:outer membrane lipoprotein-sorting protein [Polyangium sorediatum]MDI1437394.1 outer membrane lipoprotein-sorting protein [Polyangium sorediatum]HVK69624.1 outer membrane lipoprotein-sorting protein [Polyangium sp.]
MSTAFRGWLSASAPLLAALLWAGHAGADAPGDKALKAMEEAMNRAKTQYYEYEVVNKEPGKDEKKMGLKVYIKGEKRLTEFTAPADMKGTKVLILSPTQMYVYLPAFGKIRRIASHVTDQGFMGLAFSQDDLATQAYAAFYDAQLAADAGAEQTLVATAKAGQTVPNGKIEFKIVKDKNLPSEIKYFNTAGKHVKTETRTTYDCQGNVCSPQELKMVDHTKGGHWTKMVRKAWKVNEEMSDDLFSKRSLEK